VNIIITNKINFTECNTLVHPQKTESIN